MEEIRITNIADKGNLEKERIGLEVSAKLDLINYIIFISAAGKGDFQNKAVACYWFPPEMMKPGDQIVLYSKNGSERKIVQPNGKTIYFFYLNMDSSLFDDEGTGVVLVKTTKWESNKLDIPPEDNMF